ncbi:MAG: hypothetical protein ABJK59_02350 [Erythrobacter sp.]|uniref:hypothetical protein n=1 Tax=Erythrobacter sp. TaxID=1042 RepID=UPI003297DE7C
MGKQKLKMGVALIAMASGASLASGAAAAQSTPEQSAQSAGAIPNTDVVAEAQRRLHYFELTLRSAEAARLENDCDTWEGNLEAAEYQLHMAHESIKAEMSQQLQDHKYRYCYNENNDPLGAVSVQPETSDESARDVVSVIDVTSKPGADYEFIIAQLQDLGTRCENPDGSNREFLEGQKDRYGRYYREIEALEDGFRELSLTTDDREAADGYAANARKYEEALEGLPKPWEFPCSNETTPADNAVEGGDFTVVSESGLRIPNLRVLRGSLGIGQENVPSTGIGFRREGALGTAPEDFATETPDNADHYLIYAELFFKKGSLNGFYSEGDASASSSIAPNSGVDSGLVYGDLSPSGSSGIATAFGLDSEIGVDNRTYGFAGSYEIYALEAARRRLDELEADRERNRLRVQRAAITAGYQHVDRDYWGYAGYSGVQTGSTFEFSQTRDQEISEDQFHLGGEVDLVFPLSDRFAIRSQTGGGVYYRDTSLDSVEMNQNNFTGPPDEMFTVTIERDDQGIGFQGNVDLFIDFNLAPGSGPGPILSIGGGIEYQSSTGAIFNPSSGDQVFFDGLTTDLETDDTFRWFAGASITAPF